MRWMFPIYNRYDQLIARVYVRISSYSQAERKAQDHAEEKYPGAYIAYDQVERVLDEVKPEEVEL